MDNLILILAFTFAFSLFDYFAYNISAKKGWTNGLLAPYRIAQTCVQIILIAIAWAFVDIEVAIGFTILWWTWVCDWIFHLGCFGDFYDDKQYVSCGHKVIARAETCEKRNELFDKYYDFELREYKCILYWNKQISWAWWTPYGLLDLLISGKDKNTKYFKIINWKILALQSFIGIIITLILVTWSSNF